MDNNPGAVDEINNSPANDTTLIATLLEMNKTLLVLTDRIEVLEKVVENLKPKVT